MTRDAKLDALRAAIQHDVGGRGLGPPGEGLFAACAGDLAAACAALAEPSSPVLGVVTGFYIPGAGLGETDGPLGAVYLARTLPALGVGVALFSDPFCRPSLLAGLRAAGAEAPVIDLPAQLPVAGARGWFTHLLALERVGPSWRDGRCRTMRGIDITDSMQDAHGLFEGPRSAITIGIGDGGNEIGMGKLPWRLIADRVPNGEAIACRVAADHLIVAGISNWGAYALAAGVAVMQGHVPPADWFDLGHERAILARMVEEGPLVDGVTGRREPSVDGLAFDEYARPLARIGQIVRERR